MLSTALYEAIYTLGKELLIDNITAIHEEVAEERSARLFDKLLPAVDAAGLGVNADAADVSDVADHVIDSEFAEIADEMIEEDCTGRYTSMFESPDPYWMNH